MPAETGELFDCGNSRTMVGPLHSRRLCKFKMIAAEFYFIVDAVSSRGFCIKGIVTQFVQHIQDDKKTGSKTGCEANNIDSGKTFVLPQAAERGFEIVF